LSKFTQKDYICISSIELELKKMENSKQQIAIIGGGIAGLTFAKCLDPNKYECHIFEKKEAFGEIGAAISVFPNALCVIDHLHLLDKILASAGAFKKVYIKSSKGAILSKSEPNYNYPTICMHRADLHKILLDDTPAHLFTNHALKSIQQLENSRIVLTFENGQTHECDAVIGADGIHSVVRKHIINDGEPIFRGYNIWRGVVKSDFDSGYGSETMGLGKRVGIVPIKDGYYGWWAACNEDFLEEDAPEDTKEKLLRLFGSWHSPIPELIKNTDVILKNSLCDREPKKGWTIGNITLLGDAAHPTTPNLGQGGCMAIEGAYILATALNKYGITQQAFDRYEELHFPRTKMVVLESRKIGKLGQASNPVIAGLRNFIFKIMPSKVSMKLIDKFFGYRVTDLNV
jgi:2-polyprenyl-6-methoxyphenol hydroxylase-like FAD-dependent oxidoreductase